MQLRILYKPEVPLSPSYNPIRTKCRMPSWSTLLPSEVCPMYPDVSQSLADDLLCACSRVLVPQRVVEKRKVGKMTGKQIEDID